VIVGIVGPGALGTVFGAALAERSDVRVLARDNRSARAIASRGGLVVDEESPKAVRVSHDPEVLAGAEIVLVSVKTYATIEALEPLRPVLAGTVAFVSVQNGIDAIAQIEFALGHRCCVALGPTTEAAERLEAGRARRTARGMTRLGWAAGHEGGSVLDQFARALVSGGIAAELVRPVEPYVWAKLVANAAINPLTALAGVTNGELLVRPELRERAARIAREVAAVAQATKITLPFEDPAAFALDVALATGANRSSMLQDLTAGRETEIDAINGAVVRSASALSVPVPENLRVLDEVRARASA
jgi:2-dehydropantoate 2-reductase